MRVWEQMFCAALSAYGRVGVSSGHIVKCAADVADRGLEQWRQRLR